MFTVTSLFMNSIDGVQLSYNNGIITTPKPVNYKWDSKSVGCVFYECFKKHASKTIQIDGFTDEEDTYASVLQRIIRVALRMQEDGITPDDTISLCSLAHKNVCVPFFAALFLGAKIVCFDQNMNLAESKLLFRQVDPKMMFVELDALKFVEEIITASNKPIRIITFGQTSNYENFFDFLLPHPGEHEFVPVVVDETKTAFTFFSSGSTNVPKVINLSHRAYLGQIGVSLNLNEPYDRLSDLSTIYWSTTIYYWGVLVIKGCCKLLIRSMNDMELVWKAFQKHKPTFLFLTPFHIRLLWQSKPKNANVDYIKTIDLGGATMSDREVMKFRKAFPRAKIALGYGSTEAGLLLFVQTETEKDLEMYEKNVGSTGSVLNGISYKIVDVDSEEVLGPNQKGELRVKSDNLLSGFYNSNENEIYDSDGWFKTGDILYYDKDYYFYFVERLKLIIKFQSHHVSPKLIEEVLMSRDDVSNACVIGVPHEMDEEHPMAIVELNKICTIKKNIEEDIFELVKETLGDKFMLRGGVKIVDKIPITPTGKYDVRRLRTMFAKISV